MFKYGPEDFIIEQIIECQAKDVDTMEQHYVALYNTQHPNGYNMSTGGKKTTFCELARANMSAGKVGKRYRHEIERKHDEDEQLPKNIAAIRTNGKITGYQVKKFPIGIDKKEYIYKTFRNKNNPDEALQLAIAHLEQLKIQYQERLNIRPMLS